MEQIYANRWDRAQRPLVSSLRIEKSDRHWHIHIWNRGGKAGTICVSAEDGPAVANRLPPSGERAAGNGGSGANDTLCDGANR